MIGSSGTEYFLLWEFFFKKGNEFLRKKKIKYWHGYRCLYTNPDTNVCRNHLMHMYVPHTMNTSPAHETVRTHGRHGRWYLSLTNAQACQRTQRTRNSQRLHVFLLAIMKWSSSSIIKGKRMQWQCFTQNYSTTGCKSKCPFPSLVGSSNIVLALCRALGGFWGSDLLSPENLYASVPEGFSAIELQFNGWKTARHRIFRHRGSCLGFWSAIWFGQVGLFASLIGQGSEEC